MTKKEMAKIIMSIYALYPNTFQLQTDNLSVVVDAWYMVLGKQDYDATLDKLKRYAAEHRYPPAPADLYIKKHGAYETNIISEIEKWEREAVGKC